MTDFSTEADLSTAISLSNQTSTADAPAEFRFPLWCKVVGMCIFTTITVLAVIGNTAVIYIVLRFRRMRQSPTNLLIMNLAVADLMIGIMNTPTTYWPTMMIDEQTWPFGELLCVVIHVEQVAVVLVSSYTLVAISMDRFTAILFPLHPDRRLTRARALLAIAVIWTASGVVSAPIVFVQKLVRVDDGRMVCQEDPFDWTVLGFISARTYTWSLLVLQYVIPVLVLMATYAGIGVRLWNTKLPNASGENQKMLRDRRENVKRMVPMMVLVSFLYTLCWLPLNGLLVLNALFALNTTFHYVLLVWWACFTLAMSHCFINPIIYYTRNEKFKEGFHYLFRWLPCVDYEAHYLSERATAARSMAYGLMNSVALVPAVSTSGMHSDIHSGIHRRSMLKNGSDQDIALKETKLIAKKSTGTPKQSVKVSLDRMKSNGSKADEMV